MEYRWVELLLLTVLFIDNAEKFKIVCVPIKKIIVCLLNGGWEGIFFEGWWFWE